MTTGTSIDKLVVTNITSEESIKCALNTSRTPLKYKTDKTSQSLCILLTDCVTYGVKNNYMAIYVKDEASLKTLENIEDRINELISEAKSGYRPVNPIIKSAKGVFYPKLYTEFKSDKITTAFYDNQGRMIDPITYPCKVKVAITIKDIYHTATASYCQIRINEVEIIEPILRSRLL